MISTEIFMEGMQLDISDDVQALFTYQVADVADFSARNTAFSKTLSLPGTPSNNAAFGHVFEFAAFTTSDPAQPNLGANFNAAKAARGLVMQHSIQVFKGIIRLQEVKYNDGFLTYEVTLFGELGGLSSAIGTKLLTGNQTPSDDLDFSAYDQYWTFGNIVTSWDTRNSTGGGSGAYFPLIDYGNVSPASGAGQKRDYSYKAMRPALYVKEYLDKILRGAGYTYDCPFFNTAFVKRLIIPHNEDMMYRLTGTFVEAFNSGTVSPLINASIPPNFNTPVIFDSTTATLNFTNVYSGQTNGYIWTYTPTPSTVARVSANLNLMVYGGEGKILVRFYIVKNNSFAGILKQQDIVLNTSVTGAPVTVTLNAESVGLATGESIQIAVAWFLVGSGTPTNPWGVDLLPNAKLTIKPYTAAATPALYNDFLSMSQAIPKGILQRDFLLSIVKMFNLMIIEDPARNRHLRIAPYRAGMSGVADFFDNTSPLDWSGKVDRSGEISQKPLAMLTARYYKFLYETDSDYFNELYRNRYGIGYGDRNITIENDFVTETKELKVIFAPTPLVGSPYGAYAGKDKYVSAMYKIAVNSGASVEQPVATKIRILQSQRVITGAAWNILDNTGASLASVTRYGFAGHVETPYGPATDLNFGSPRELYWEPTAGSSAYNAANVFNAFQYAYLAEISNKDSRVFTAPFYLTPMDIANLDFGKSIVIDGQLWRLNKIIDFDSVHEGLTKVELLRVINLTY